MKISRFSKAGPPRLPSLPGGAQRERNIAKVTEDSVLLSAASQAPSKAWAWQSALGLGLASIAAFSSIMSPSAQAGELSVREQNFALVESLVYSEKEAPCGDSIDLLKEYAQTEFGAPIIADIARDAQQALENGFITPEGEVTIDGQFEGFEPFRIQCGSPAQGGPNGIILPASYPEKFQYSGQEIHPLAIVHHEMGHTKYGLPATLADIVTDEHGSRYSVEYELEIVEKFENPVRVEYGFAPRTSYTNHLGETAVLPSN